MQKTKIIFNPNAGRQSGQKTASKLAYFLKCKTNTEIHLSSTVNKFDAENIAYQSCAEGYDTIITVGGDGTVNEVINGMMKSEVRGKLAIYPAGTMNDLSSYLKTPKNPEAFAQMIADSHTMKIDVGVGGERYFLNVAAAGLLPDVAHKVSSVAKTALGKFAYYMEGIKEFPKQIFKPIKIQLKIRDNIIHKDILFFIIANSPKVGGFKIANKAAVDDGLLDLIIIEDSLPFEIAGIFLKVLSGSLTEHSNLHYVQVKEFTVYCDEFVSVDMDGELSGQLPMHFKVEKQAIDIIIPAS